MAQFIQRIDNLGRREASTLAASTTQRVFATLSAMPPDIRQAVSINNCDASADLWVRFTPANDSSPTISSSDSDLIIPPKSSRQLQIGSAIDVWIRQESGGTTNYTATELL